MTSAITRAHAGAAHAHGFAKELKGDAPAEGFEALFAAVAVAVTHPLPALSPGAADAAAKRSDEGKAGEGTREDGTAPAQVALLVASMPPVAPEAKGAAPRSAPAASSPIVAAAPGPVAPRVAALENSGTASTPAHAPPPAPASQTFVPNAAFAILEPVAHALIAHKGRVAENPAPPPADPPRVTRAPMLSELAASSARQASEPIGAPVPNHAEPDNVSPAPPSSPSQTSAEHGRSNLSPRALVQAAMVEVVRSPGRGRPSPPDAANADAQDAAPVQTAAPDAQPAGAASSERPGAASVPSVGAPAQQPPLVEQAMPADGAATIAQPVIEPSAAARPAPASRAAADIARQREFVRASAEMLMPADANGAETTPPPFDALIALRKADGTLDGRAPSAPGIAPDSPSAPSGAWLANIPASSAPASAPSAASTVAMPRIFDQAAWGAALAQQVTASAIAATRETTVRIKPDGLGPIEVRVRVGAEHVDVRFAIEHPVTVNMVREALPDLQRMLAQSGLNLGDAQVAQQNAGSRGQAARGDASRSEAGDDEPASVVRAAAEARPRARSGLLDDFV